MNRLFYALSCFCCFVLRGMQPDAVFFNAEAVVVQDITAKKIELAKLLYGSYEGWSTDLSLLKRMKSAFEISVSDLSWSDMLHPIESAEIIARYKFFKLLREIRVSGQPVTPYEGVQLPKLLAAWVHGKLSDKSVMKCADEHIDRTDKSDEDKRFLHATVRMTVDAQIMAGTSILNEKAKMVLDHCAKKRIPAYMVGFCAPAPHALLQKRGDAGHVLGRFKKILLSHQCNVDEHTRFDDRFWVNEIAQTGEPRPHAPIFVESARVAGPIAPGHYKVDDSTLLLAIDRQ